MVCAHHVGDAAARLAHDQAAGGGIPGFQVELPKGFETATSGVAKIQRRRAHASDTMAAQSDGVIEVDIRIAMALMGGKAGGDERLAQLRHRGDLNAASVEAGALAGLGREKLIEARMINDAGLKLAFTLEGDRNGEPG